MCLVTGAMPSVKTVVYGSRVPRFLRLCHSSGVQTWPYRRGPSLIPEQSMWNLELGQVSVRVLRFYPVIVIPQILRNYSFIYHQRGVILCK